MPSVSYERGNERGREKTAQQAQEAADAAAQEGNGQAAAPPVKAPEVKKSYYP